MLAHAGGADEFLSTALVGVGVVTAWVGSSSLRGRGFGRLPRWGGWTLVALAPLAMVTAVVVPSRLWPSPTPAADRPSSTVSIAIAEPAPGESVSGETLEVRIELEGGRVVTETTSELRPDTGHLHLFLDGAMMSMAYDQDLRVSLPISDLAPGAHELRAEFVAADHASFDPRVVTAMTFLTE